MFVVLSALVSHPGVFKNLGVVLENVIETTMWTIVPTRTQRDTEDLDTNGRPWSWTPRLGSHAR